MSAGRAMALGGFALRANLRSGMTRGGMVAFVAIVVLGPLASLRSGSGWALDPDLLFYGYLTGALLALRSGLEQQRESGLQAFLRHDFCSPAEHAAGAVLALMAMWAILTAGLFLVALACAPGDAAGAVWHAWTFGLALALLLPFVLVVEATMSLRIPLILPVIAYFTLMVVLALTLGEERMVAVLGLGADRTDPAGSLPLARRVGVVVPVGLALFVAAAALPWGRRRADALPAWPVGR